MTKSYAKGEIISSTPWMGYFYFWERRRVFRAAVDYQSAKESGHLVACTERWEYRRL